MRVPRGFLVIVSALGGLSAHAADSGDYFVSLRGGYPIRSENYVFQDLLADSPAFRQHGTRGPGFSGMLTTGAEIGLGNSGFFAGGELGVRYTTLSAQAESAGQSVKMSQKTCDALVAQVVGWAPFDLMRFKAGAYFRMDLFNTVTVESGSVKEDISLDETMAWYEFYASAGGGFLLSADVWMSEDLALEASYWKSITPMNRRGGETVFAGVRHAF